QNSTQQIAQRIYRHLKPGYSFSKSDVTSYTEQLEQMNLLYKLPYGPHYKVSVDAVSYIVINLLEQLKDLIRPILIEISNVYHQQDRALNFITVLL
ncbi:hypothetical protein, partial [Streptomyces niveiscabiei]|uniref:hypothetical protein n=1 Tax=Streptomyces niveiscabiei TaxID=164115 RepID=UPI0038F6C371